jgi:hypothetical protein
MQDQSGAGKTHYCSNPVPMILIIAMNLANGEGSAVFFEWTFESFLNRIIQICSTGLT